VIADFRHEADENCTLLLLYNNPAECSSQIRSS